MLRLRYRPPSEDADIELEDRQIEHDEYDIDITADDWMLDVVKIIEDIRRDETEQMQEVISDLEQERDLDETRVDNLKTTTKCIQANHERRISELEAELDLARKSYRCKQEQLRRSKEECLMDARQYQARLRQLHNCHVAEMAQLRREHAAELDARGVQHAVLIMVHQDNCLQRNAAGAQQEGIYRRCSAI